jgi:hypothetical protein
VAFTSIDACLIDLAVPTEERDILFRLRLQIVRDLGAGSQPKAFPDREPDPLTPACHGEP